ncbi:MAG: DUF6477 family protein [Thalassovita sp.]|nr:DUF6477 family protein [Thalassovita sp.]
MTDVFGLLSQIKRPGLLIRAARSGVDDYNHNAHLPRLLPSEILPRGGEALIRLIEIENDLNRERLQNSAGYSCARHVEVLIAIMGETRLLRAAPGKREVA